jgi:hypothetical protein
MAERLGSTTSVKKSDDGSTSPEIRVILETGVEVPGEILNVSRAGMHVRFPVRFADGAVLSFRVRDCTAMGQVLYCRPDGDRFFVALTMSGDRRSEPRLSANEQITLVVISAEKPGRIRGRLIDVSQSGVGLRVESSVRVGALVEVRANGGSLLYGEVRNCARAPEGGFRIGILTEESFFGDLRERHLISWRKAAKSYAARIWQGICSWRT